MELSSGGGSIMTFMVAYVVRRVYWSSLLVVAKVMRGCRCRTIFVLFGEVL